MTRPSLLARPALLLAALLPFLTSCTEAGASGSTQDFFDRLAAAQGIVSTTKRDVALGAVARDAGRAGSGEVAFEAVKRITAPYRRSSTARDVARSLAKAGAPGAATKVAQKILDTATRDATLAEIAETGN